MGKDLERYEEYEYEGLEGLEGLERLEAIEELNAVSGYDRIYPFDCKFQGYYGYKPDELAGFSKRAIEKYNQDTHKRYHFVELLEGFLFSTCVDCVTTYFNACQPGDMNVTFVAMTQVPYGTLSLPPYPEIIDVLPFPTSACHISESGDLVRPPFVLLPLPDSCSDTSSTYAFESRDRQQEKPLAAQVGLLKI